MMVRSQAQLENLSSAISDLVEKIAPSIVSIHTSRSRSSGFVWREGLVVTADESLPDDGDAAITPMQGNTVPASVVGRDSTTDVALLRVESPSLPPVTLDSSPVKTGQSAVAIGAEEGVALAAFGIVSRTTGSWRSLRGGEIDAWIELDLRLPRNAEGGLALNAFGRPVGMAVFGARKRVLVIPNSTVERVAAKLASHGYVARGYLGLGLQPVSIEGGEGWGAMVMSVDPKGPARAAGIQQGDILVAWNDEPIPNIRFLSRVLGPDSVGKEAIFDLRRGQETRQVRLTIGERPAD
jgi:S1-C subfamily serine protease